MFPHFPFRRRGHRDRGKSHPALPRAGQDRRALLADDSAPRLRVRGEGAARGRHNVAQAADSRRGAAPHRRRDLLTHKRKIKDETEGPRLFRFLSAFIIL